MGDYHPVVERLASNLFPATVAVAGSQWGDEDHVRSLFAGDGRRLELERASVRIRLD